KSTSQTGTVMNRPGHRRNGWKLGRTSGGVTRLCAAVLLALGCLATAAGAQVPDSGRRLALVIGNETYPSSALRNPGNDARAMKTALTDAGFQVDLVTDVNFKEMSAAVNGFIAKI